MYASVVMHWYRPQVLIGHRINFLPSNWTSCLAVIALAPSRSVLRLLVLKPVSSVNVYLASPVCGVEGYKLEATPLMIQKGPRYVWLSRLDGLHSLFIVCLSSCSFFLWLFLSLSLAFYLYVSFAFSVIVISFASVCCWSFFWIRQSVQNLRLFSVYREIIIDQKSYSLCHCYYSHTFTRTWHVSRVPSTRECTCLLHKCNKQFAGFC